MVIVSAWLDYFPNRLSDVKLRYSYRRSGNFCVKKLLYDKFSYKNFS